MNIGERFGLLPNPDFKLVGDDGDIEVSRTCIFNGERITMRLPIDRERFERWRDGVGMIQEIFPELTADQREFLISGATQEIWEQRIAKLEDEEE